ncbi:hypothetical protein H112_08004 [Trichophyton rubrum D6]|uniref:Nucleotidyl transferase AbiEii/AbiGii toxin family protein n=1 Tax=Trichophyton rubrum CBS 288.86 TaxID=1215330 RepID=A0A022VQR2_TRIRU|nr:hypothetical protein H100_08032 [Trichophyton rubrum MR850]EZF37696.1 hypothetical protein H102_07990 [Trichophyton rubrum CBS 100081]EZF48376.1 hypothetical protein H103_08015 [Trichophyton rubrum CBS 288.86]EZF58967.1 hypothetical protein H104_07963 [Trichophyton rubrum CBS 289.86]EZF80254.1 hypothetical protein H110_08015 [Trichophyton rubrum MR1448]EZF90915.1 hypothetical protein H113_08078 [Trichophyton rubrum MR1459]EZG12481.1 hypothetical protein H107_08155 [Trichophyton rubrum CBS 
MATSTELPTLKELEDTVRAAIDALKQYPEFGSAKLAIIGGTALWKYIPSGRTTKDVDFLNTVSGARQAVKAELLRMLNSCFAEYAQLFVYKHLSGKSIQIDYTPEWQSAYVPEAARPISTINSADLPYISAVDLLAFKINTCGMRPTVSKKTQDALNAMAIAENILAQGPIVLTNVQKEAARAGIEDVATWSKRHSTWWNQNLQL